MNAQLQGLSPTERFQAFRFSLFQQLPCAVLTALMLDGGRMVRICLMAMLVYWAAVAWLLVRRPLCKGTTDLVFVRWGFLPIFVASLMLAAFLKR
jgi:hypothetical protein